MSIDTASTVAIPAPGPLKEHRMDPRADVTALVEILNDRERTILVDRLAAEHPKTLEAIGQQFGVSRERVRQIETEVMSRLKAFPWVVLMAGVVPVYGQWIRHLDQVNDNPAAAAWNAPVVAEGPTTLQLLLAAGQFELTQRQWLWRRMSNRWIELVEAGSSGTVPVDDFLAELQSLGLPPALGTRWIESNGLTVSHGLVRSRHMTLAEFLVAELTAAGGTASFDTIMSWVGDRWSRRATKNELQKPGSTFTRIDVQEYALASLGLPKYTNIRECIRAVIEENGPLALAEVVAIVCDSYDVAATSVAAGARERPFRVTDGIVDFLAPSATSSSRRRGTVSLADIPEGRRWRGAFFTPTGFAFRFVVKTDHLRGSGYATSTTLARIVGLRQGDVWERPLENVDATLRIYRKVTSQPAIGSIKAALDVQGAVEGDIAFIRFEGAEGAIERVSLTVEKRLPSANDPFAQALMLVGCTDEDVEDPFDALCAALGVEADFATELVAVATRRKDPQLAAALAALAAL